jgi:MoaA/NifB/PqqE/SkfB family radical SAM enzyme
MLTYSNIKNIHFELSSVCNAACPNCPRNVHGGFLIDGFEEVIVSLSSFQKILDEKTLKQLTQIRFCGNYGDPVTCKDLPDIIEWIYSVSPTVKIEINTNGGVRSKEWWARLGSLIPQSGNSVVIFSIDGLEDTNHLYRRNVNWSKLIGNVSAFIQAGGKALWEMLVFRHNQEQISKARQLAKELGFIHFRVKNPFGFNDTFRQSSYMAVNDRDGNFEYALWPKNSSPMEITGRATYNQEAYKEQAKLANQAVFTDQIEIAQYLEYLDTNYDKGIDCMTARDKEIYIDSKGNLYPCCFLGHASQPAISRENIFFRKWIEENVGWDKINLFNYSIEEIISGPYFSLISQTWDVTHGEGKIRTCSLMCSSDCAKNTMRNLYD